MNDPELQEPELQEPERVWFEPGDIAHLTFVDEATGLTEDIRALCVKPRGSYMGWVLADGTRLPLRPRTVITIGVVFPEHRRATEHVVHPDPEPEHEHTTTEHTTQGESPE